MQSLFVDQLTVIDFSYFHSSRGIVGESLILDLQLHGELNEQGMLFDFSFVKQRIKACVDQLVDHKLLVASQQPHLKIQRSLQQLRLTLLTNNGEHYQHLSPEQAVCFIDSTQVTAESIALTISKAIQGILPDNVSRADVSLRPEIIDGYYYHYSHGLKKHFGDCQRIAHGHRSKIEVWENDEYSQKWSSHIADIWCDIYLATQQDVKEQLTIEQTDYWLFEYQANQGQFQLRIPKQHCFLLNTDSTVELIAAYLANDLKQKKPDSKFKVKSFEGVDKGAIVEID